ncbi:hypothetical protein [Sphingomonas humi]|uniref:Uncharacterized protein n=1 Tax=Sphingomonas humi TaxID=335630 RepID=A0ABP7S4H4_9SPHN
MKLGRALTFPLALLPIGGLLVSGFLGLMLWQFKTEPQTYATFNCGANATGDCLGWSIVTTGVFYPFYLIAFGVAFSLAVLVVVAPIAFAISLWLRLSSPDAETASKPRLTIVRFFKILYDDGPGPNA